MEKGEGRGFSSGNKDIDFGGVYQFLEYHGSKGSGVADNIQGV